MGLEKIALNFMVKNGKGELVKSILCHTKPPKIQNIQGLRYVPKQSEDVFIKTDKSLKDTISKLNLNSYINDTYFIGEGVEAAIYRIENTPYLLRVPHTDTKDVWQGIWTRGKTVDGTKLDISVSPQEKINHVVANIGNAQILKYIEGCNTSSASNNIEVFNTIDNLSINSIKDFFLKIVQAKRVGMVFDSCGANCIINIKTGKLTPIDFRERQLSTSYLLDSLIESCVIPLKKIGGNEAQDKLIKKGIIAILEMLKDGKITARDANITFSDTLFESRTAKNMLRLYNNIIKNYSAENINRILAELKNVV